MTFDTIYKWAKLCAVLSVVPVMIVLAMFLWQSMHTTNQILWSVNTTVTTVNNTVSALPQQVDTRVGKLQKDVLDKIDTVQDKLNTEVTTLVTKADDRIDNLTTTTDNRIGKLETDVFKAVADINTNINTQLTTTNTNVNTQLTTLNNNIGTVTTAYAGVPQAMSAYYTKNFGNYFDCSMNKLCLQGQTSDTLFAFRTASRDLSTTLPLFEKDFSKITGNFASITANINTMTKPHWYDRLIGYGLNGIIMYRNLNPVTSLTVTGAQIISSQK